ncbi:PRK domain-containing protein [Heracleum sosnowskyi]|uniref:PRK domain-containing protein n=1 Tax=Heracleum sosnowskyi TaxID=360622 RepID=A0AAD8MW67_9APIA|nr:PRK domain-containing protein [Heracleum sosnowskyi]
MVLRGTNRKTVGAEASRMGINGPWIRKSYLEMILKEKVITYTCASRLSVTTNEGGLIAAPKPLRAPPNLVNPLDDMSQPWTRSPTKSKMEPVLATWQFISSDHPGTGRPAIDPSSRDSLQLAPMPDSYDLDRGLLLSVQAIQALLENKGHPVIVGIGGPSGSGKTSLALKDFKYDDFSSPDLTLLSKNIDDMRNFRKTKVPVFDLETGARSVLKELEVSEECGVFQRRKMIYKEEHHQLRAAASKAKGEVGHKVQAH